MIAAYVLAQTGAGRALDILETVRLFQGVVGAEAVIGPYDVIIRCECTDSNDLGRLIVEKIQQVPGVHRTVTCQVVYSS